MRTREEIEAKIKESNNKFEELLELAREEDIDKCRSLSSQLWTLNWVLNEQS